MRLFDNMAMFYAYEPICLYSKGKDKPTATVYSDRLKEWDAEKYSRLTKKYFNNDGDYWDNRESSDIEKFLQEYMDENSLVLVNVIQQINQSNGYPVWQFGYTIL